MTFHQELHANEDSQNGGLPVKIFILLLGFLCPVLLLDPLNDLSTGGKNYKKGTPATNPGGQFVEPSSSSSTLLNFRCWPRVQPYLAGETSGQIIIDAGLTSLKIPGTQAFSGGSGSFSVKVTANVNGATVSLASGSVAVNATGALLPFDPSVLPTSTTPATISCTATLGSATYKTTGTVSHLPAPGQGSVTKQDFLTGALLVPETSNLTGAYKPIIPFGFYTGFDDYLANDPVTIVDNAKKSGLAIFSSHHQQGTDRPAAGTSFILFHRSWITKLHTSLSSTRCRSKGCT